MDDRPPYPAVTRILRMMPKAFIPHWYAGEERRGILRAIKELGLDATVEKYQTKERCKDKACTCDANRWLKEGGEKGDAFHKAVYAFLEGKDRESIDAGGAVFAFKRFLKWWDKNSVELGIEIVKKEFRVINHRWKYWGIADVMFRCKRGLILGDWKTSNNNDANFRLQVAAYVGAYLEENGLEWNAIDGALIIRFDKREKAPRRTIDEEWLTRDQLKRYYRIFCCLREPYDFALENDLLKVGD